jgi:cytochrome c5
MKLASLALTASLVVVLSACGKQEQAAAPEQAPAAPAAPAAPEAAAPVMAANEQGKSTYNKVCALCHGVGAAGAPKPGDKADWEPRIAQGTDVLYKHAIEGYTGSKGVMPARGGAASLPDDEVKAAVDYMVEQSK